jgi:5'-methylthioadenosine phosphorylase
MGWHAINMTAYPEGHLARELEMCYANISLVTDYDVGLEGMPGITPVSLAEVFEVFSQNNERLRDLLFSVIPRIPGEQDSCGSALDGAVMGGH